MIKLENLKKGDTVYLGYEYHWIMKIEIINEIREHDRQTPVDPIEYYVGGIVVSPDKFNDRDRQNLFRDDELGLFRTLTEAVENKNKFRQDKIQFLLRDNNLLKTLYKAAQVTMTNADKELYEEIISMH